MCLPPCVLTYQISLDHVKMEMHIHVYQRSADAYLGLPYDIAHAYELLKYFASQNDNFKMGKIFYTIANFHIYTNHITQTRKYLKTKIINKGITNYHDYEAREIIPAILNS